MNAIVAVLVLATEAGEERSGLDLVLPDTAELLWGLIGFALLMVVLFAKVFPALNAILAERQARIQGRLEEAESIRVEAEQLRTRYQEQLADARSQANVIVDDAKGQAERVRADIIGRAQPAGAGPARAGRDPVGRPCQPYRPTRAGPRAPPGTGRPLHHRAVGDGRQDRLMIFFSGD
jgi:hypothetical protein